MKDLFGEEIVEDVLLRDKFIEPPFSVLDTRSGSWQNRKRQWKEIGIKSECGRNARTFNNKEWMDNVKGTNINDTDTSIFDESLTELMYRWFCPENGKILDTFAGGSVRGIIANYLGYNYTGIELRQEQVENNIEQGLNIIPNNTPKWICGDSEYMIDALSVSTYDMLFTCPPYGNLEVYSDLPCDLSNMDYKDFINKLTVIIKKSLKLLKPGCFAVIVVGAFRDKNGYYNDFIGDVTRAHIGGGAKLYNDMILLNSVGSASMRASKQFVSSKKVCKIHQNVLCFKKI